MKTPSTISHVEPTAPSNPRSSATYWTISCRLAETMYVGSPAARGARATRAARRRAAAGGRSPSPHRGSPGAWRRAGPSATSSRRPRLGASRRRRGVGTGAATGGADEIARRQEAAATKRAREREWGRPADQRAVEIEERCGDALLGAIRLSRGHHLVQHVGFVVPEPAPRPTVELDLAHVRDVRPL